MQTATPKDRMVEAVINLFQEKGNRYLSAKTKALVAASITALEAVKDSPDSLEMCTVAHETLWQLAQRLHIIQKDHQSETVRTMIEMLFYRPKKQ